VLVGVIPNVDRVSFIGDVGLGYRTLSQKLEPSVGPTQNRAYTGVEYGLGVGLSIPAGPIRIVPKASILLGEFSDVSDCTGSVCKNLPIDNKAGHSSFFVGLGVYYSADLGKKTSTPQ
jgi:hypothetical protein